MTNLNKFKYMELDDYSTSVDTEDSICAVDVTDLFGDGLFPDWDNAVSLTSGTSYTVGSGALASYKAGYIWFGGERGGYRTCDINGVTFLGGYDYEDGHEGKTLFFPVSVGDVITCTNGSERLFLPVRGSL